MLVTCVSLLVKFLLGSGTLHRVLRLECSCIHKILEHDRAFEESKIFRMHDRKCCLLRLLGGKMSMSNCSIRCLLPIMLLTHHFTIKSFDVQGGKRKDAA
jgi:hypothetical protein